MENLTDRQKQIIQTSIHLIAQKGIQGLTIKNIAKAIGISEPAIYRHFDNKNDIILGIISVLKNTTGNGISEKPDGRGTFDLINKMIHGHTSRFIENPSLTAIVFSEEIFNNNSNLAKIICDMMKLNQDKLIGIIENGQEKGDIRNDLNANQLSLMIIGSYRFLVVKWHLTKFEFDLRKEVNDLLAALETALAA